MYEPRARVTHVRYGSAGADAAAKLSERNRRLFAARWTSRLEGRPPTFTGASEQAAIASRDACARPRLLVCSGDDPPTLEPLAGAVIAGWRRTNASAICTSGIPVSSASPASCSAASSLRWLAGSDRSHERPSTLRGRRGPRRRGRAVAECSPLSLRRRHRDPRVGRGPIEGGRQHPATGTGALGGPARREAGDALTADNGARAQRDRPRRMIGRGRGARAQWSVLVGTACSVLVPSAAASG